MSPISATNYIGVIFSKMVFKSHAWLRLIKRQAYKDQIMIFPLISTEIKFCVCVCHSVYLWNQRLVWNYSLLHSVTF